MTFDTYQDRSRAGCVTWTRSGSVPGQASRRGTGPGSFEGRFCDVKQVPGSFWLKIQDV